MQHFVLANGLGGVTGVTARAMQVTEGEKAQSYKWSQKERRPQMEERRDGQETRKEEVRSCATPSDQGFDHCETSKTSKCASSRERSLTKTPSNATRRSFWTGYTPRPAAACNCDEATGIGIHRGDEKEKGDDKSSTTRESVHESV